MFPGLQGSTTLSPKDHIEIFFFPFHLWKPAAVTVAASCSKTYEAEGSVERMMFSTPSYLFLCGGSDSSTFLHILL